MYNMLSYILAMGIFCSLLLLTIMIAFKDIMGKEKSRPFECGLDPTGSSRIPFCMKFFLVGVIFLIFDVEVSLVLPLPFRSFYFIIFLIVLMLGLVYE